LDNDIIIYSSSATEPAYLWVNTHEVKFTLKIGQYYNVIDFLNQNKLSFLITMPIDFSSVSPNLIGKGNPKNLSDYLAFNESNYILTLNFLNYFLNTICDFRYSSNNKKLVYVFRENTKITWKTVVITISGSGVKPPKPKPPLVTTTTTTIAPPITTTTTTLPTGTSGTSGTSGIDGKDGVIGTSGANGTSGSSGTDGTSGTSGADHGTSGTDGTSGSSGTDGTSGSSGTDGTSGYLPQLGLDGQVVYRDQAAEYWYNTSSGLTFTEQTLKVTGYGDILQCFSYNSGVTKNILTVKDDDSDDLLTVFSDTDTTLFKITNDGYFLMNGKIISSTNELLEVTFGSFEITSFPKISGTTAFIDYYISNVITGITSIQAGNIIAVWNNSSLTYSGTTSIELNTPVSGASISVSMIDNDIKIYFDVVSGIWNCKISLKIM
jgi:hypothetical protein